MSVKGQILQPELIKSLLTYVNTRSRFRMCIKAHVGLSSSHLKQAFPLHLRCSVAIPYKAGLTPEENYFPGTRFTSGMDSHLKKKCLAVNFFGSSLIALSRIVKYCNVQHNTMYQKMVYCDIRL